MGYRLIALDLDGTLLHKSTVSPANRAAVAKALEAGIPVILATGRPIYNVRATIELLGLNLPIVASSGGEIWKNPEEMLSRSPIDSGLAKAVFELVQSCGDDDIMFRAHTVGGSFERDAFPYDDVASHLFLTLVIHSKNEETLAGIRKQVESRFNCEVSNSSPRNLEINAAGVNKATGLAQVLDLLDINMSDVIAVGDSLNDVPMLKAAGLGVAMGNAQPAVKDIADAVAPSVQEDGVAWVFKTYLNG